MRALIQTAIRMTIGLACIAMALVYAFLSANARVARYGLQPHTDWRLLTFGIILAVAGVFLLRPFQRLSR